MAKKSQESHPYPSSNSISVYDVMEDMETIHKYLHRGGGLRRQTTLTSFMSVADCSNSNPKVTQVDPPASRRHPHGIVSSHPSSRSESAEFPSYKRANQATGQSGHTTARGCKEASPVKETTGRPKRTCPFYKKLPGTGFTVDAFKYGSIPGCIGYFLSHFHADHYQGLNRQFEGTLYCSKVTANLVIERLKVAPTSVHALTLNIPHFIEGVEVTLLDANHCPGAVLLLFQLSSGGTYLHTGDFRFCSSMLSYPQLFGLTINELYLDTTYCDQKYDFPKQAEAISYAMEKSVQVVSKNPNTLIVCGTYTIGKEKFFQGLHVLPIGKLNFKYLLSYLEQFGDKYTAIVAFKPTGWMYSGSLSSVRPQTSGPISIYGIPYSEHSSYTELREFVQYLRPLKIIPTVDNASSKRREEMQKNFREWLSVHSTVPAKKQTTLLESFKIK
ncbi:DNA cross-link repair 1A protein-like isoform X2 [Halichondria panicea]|uniref:DNA cross-link repair 1A protein-like isoform X2 n=1 Tax=Halichondria panicea TaxID=6063 RepID=UPI00312B88BA